MCSGENDGEESEGSYLVVGQVNAQSAKKRIQGANEEGSADRQTQEQLRKTTEALQQATAEVSCLQPHLLFCDNNCFSDISVAAATDGGGVAAGRPSEGAGESEGEGEREGARRVGQFVMIDSYRFALYDAT